MTLLMPEGQAANAELLKIAEEFMAQVRAGRVISFGLVTVSPLGQMATVATGGRNESVYLGCDLLKSQILGAMAGMRRAQ